jgi:hypothetical protein
MALYAANVYMSDTFGGPVVAAATPNDGVTYNVLIGTRLGENLYGENTGGVVNEMHGLRGNDVMYGGSGIGSFNIYVGGSGVDTAVIPAGSGSVSMSIDYQGGIQFQRSDGRKDYVSSDTEIVQFSQGNRFLIISGGVDDETSETNSIFWRAGDRLAISQDWLIALNSGLVGMSVRDVNGDGRLDTALTGYGGVNTYNLLDYNMNTHAAYIVGFYGDGLLFDLG